MTLAICIYCGEKKTGAWTPCRACGRRPTGVEDIARSVTLSDQHLAPQGLEMAQQAVKAKYPWYEEPNIKRILDRYRTQFSNEKGELDLSQTVNDIKADYHRRMDELLATSDDPRSQAEDPFNSLDGSQVDEPHPRPNPDTSDRAEGRVNASTRPTIKQDAPRSLVALQDDQPTGDMQSTSGEWASWLKTLFSVLAFFAPGFGLFIGAIGMALRGNRRQCNSVWTASIIGLVLWSGVCVCLAFAMEGGRLPAALVLAAIAFYGVVWSVTIFLSTRKYMSARASAVLLSCSILLVSWWLGWQVFTGNFTVAPKAPPTSVAQINLPAPTPSFSPGATNQANEAVVTELTSYFNEFLPRSAVLEDKAINRWIGLISAQTPYVPAAAITEREILPVWRTYINTLQQVHPVNSDLREIHQIVIDVANTRLRAFETFIRGVRSQDQNMILDAERLMQQTKSGIDNLVSRKQQVCAKYGIASLPSATPVVTPISSPIAAPEVVPMTMEDWKLVTQAVAFGGRAEHRCLVFGNQIWLLAGSMGRSRTVQNDVWRSVDGVNWMPVTNAAAFPKRDNFGSVVFQNRMWIIGGLGSLPSNAPVCNDVWCSSDGMNWMRTAPTYPLPPKYEHACVVFNNRIWVIGGQGWAPSTPRNDVWCSGDGINWAQATRAAAFSPRSGHKCVAFNNRLWLIGGSENGTYKNDVWSSVDGVNWMLVTPSAAFPPRYQHSAVVYDGKMWIIGGKNGSVLGDVWTSSDGMTWQQVPSSGEMSPRWQADSIVYGGKIVTMGGVSSAGTHLSDVWSYTVSPNVSLH